MFRHLLNRPGEFSTFGAADPADLETSRLKTNEFQKAFKNEIAPPRMVIATNIVAVTGVSPADQHTIGTPLEST